MTNSKSRIFAAVAGALAMGTAAAAWAEPAQDARIQELEAKVAALQANQASSSKDIAATIDGILRDAEKRSQLLAAGNGNAGYDNGFFIQGGNFLIRPGVQFQFRNVTTWRDDADSSNQGSDDDGDEIESGFEVRRLKFSLEGYVFTQALRYNFVWATDREGGSMFLEDAIATYMFSDDWGLKAGQFKDPVHHEELVSSKRQLAVDRSVVNEVLGGGVVDRTQGVSLLYGNYSDKNPLNAEVVFHDGFNEDNTDFTKHDFDFGMAGRLEYKAQGSWDQYKDFSAMGNKESLLVFGLGGDWSQNGDTDVYHGTIDAQWENANGLGIFGALLVQHSDTSGDEDFTNWGFVLQAGYLLNPSWELFGRYGLIDFDGDIITNDGDDEDVFHEFTVGVNYFLGGNGAWGHRAKITVDLTYIPDAASSVHNQTGIGLLGDGDDEVSLRTQFQLLI